MDAIKAPVEQLIAFNDSLRDRYDYAVRVQAVVVLLCLSAAYLHLVVRRFAPGLKSLLATIPVLILNVWLPMLFDSRTELVTRVVSSRGTNSNVLAVAVCLWDHSTPIAWLQLYLKPSFYVALQVLGLLTFWLGNFKVWLAAVSENPAAVPECSAVF